MKTNTFFRLLNLALGMLVLPAHAGSGSQPLIPSGPIANAAYAALLQEAGWPSGQLNTAAEATYLSDEEKNLILAMNLVRHDPARYADDFVAPAIAYYRGREYHFPGRKHPVLTQEGVAPARELYRELKAASPLPLLRPSEGLSRAAKSHALHQKRTGETGHEGQGGLRGRAEREGRWRGQLAENLAYNNPSAHEAVLGLLINDGVPGRGHRRNILNENFHVVGTGRTGHPHFPGGVHVIKFATAFQDARSK